MIVILESPPGKFQSGISVGQLNTKQSQEMGTSQKSELAAEYNSRQISVWQLNKTVGKSQPGSQIQHKVEK